MIKKSLIISLILITTVICVFAHENRFYTALQKCSPYTNYGDITTDGTKVKVKEEILGWENNKCVYKEQVNISGINSTVTCKLTQPQINELLRVMRAYSTIQEYSGEDVDISSTEAVKNNPIVKVWNKYLNNPSVCTIDSK